MKKFRSRVVFVIVTLLLSVFLVCCAKDSQKDVSVSKEETMASSELSTDELNDIDKDKTSSDEEIRVDGEVVEELVEKEKTQLDSTGNKTDTNTSNRSDNINNNIVEENKKLEKEDNNHTETEKPEVNIKEVMPWEKLGAKQPKEYTAVEYEALTTIQKEAFIASFNNIDEFNNWMNRVTGNAGSTETNKMPWENGGKQPAEYTWAEYEALTAIQKEAFFDSFKSADDFDNWKKRVTGEVSKMPWENGGKQPEEYTWAEYEALTAIQKEAFFDSFGSVDSFDNWMNCVTGNSGATATNKMPWENGGKQPAEYTWAEYEALTVIQKEAFYESFESAEAFDNWMNRVTGNSGSTESNKMPWENGGKQPVEYTWEEYEALTAIQKEAFFDSFGSADSFDSWMNRVTGNDGSGESNKMPWENGGKQPVEYTWVEYEALTAIQKEAFFDSFASIDDFDAWLAANKPQ